MRYDEFLNFKLASHLKSFRDEEWTDEARQKLEKVLSDYYISYPDFINAIDDFIYEMFE